MSVFVLAALATGAIFLSLAFFGGKGGPREAVSEAPSRQASGWLSRLSADGLEKLLRRLFAAMRVTVEQSEIRGSTLDMVVVAPTPLLGGRMHVRGLVQADHGMIEQAEVQAALDEAHGEGMAKAVLVSPLGFSDEARLAVQGTTCELVDAPALLALVRKHLPEADEAAGAGYV